MKMHTVWLGAALFWGLAAGGVYAQGSYPIWGTHFYGTGEENDIMLNHYAWTVEMYYTDDTEHFDANRWNQERAKFQAMRNARFRIILRIDRSYGDTIPPDQDWEGRYYFAYECRKIAENVGDYCEAIIIGNELRDAPDCARWPKQWYATVFNSNDNDQNCVYKQVKAVKPNLKVGIYAPGGWPGDSNLAYWDYVVNNVKKDASNKPQIDCFPLHAYSGASTVYDTRVEDPRFPSECDFGGFYPYMRRIYAIFGASKPVYITETNTQWFFGKWADNGLTSDLSYRDDWIKEAYHAIDNWNRANDLKVCCLCWYVYQHQCGLPCDQYSNSLVRTDNARMIRARNDFRTRVSWGDLVPGNPGSTLKWEAENFTNSDTREGRGWTNGIEGTDFHDTDSVNSGNFYRWTGADVGVKPDYSVVFLGWTAPGEWTRYEGLFGGYNYRIRCRYSRGISGNSTVRWYVDGVQKGALSLAGTGSWDNYLMSAQTGSFYIPPGDHYITMYFDHGSVNIDYFEFVRQ